jgi:hypothetical protein
MQQKCGELRIMITPRLRSKTSLRQWPRFVALILVSTLLLTLHAFSLPGSPSLAPHVDPRVELVSIVCRLTGADWPYYRNFLKQYTTDIDSYFSPYRQHPAVLLMKKLAEKDDFDIAAPMQIAVRISPPPALEPLVVFTDDEPGDGFDKQTALLLVQRLQEFYRDTHFDKFLAEHEALYRLSEERFSNALRDLDPNWFRSYYGDYDAGNYNLILSMTNGGNDYGARIAFPDGHRELFSIVSAWSTDSSGNPIFDSKYLDEVTHEFNHSFVNPAFDRHKSEFIPAQKVFDQVADQMRKAQYPNSDIMVYESLVRVNVILYLESRGRGHAEIQDKIREEQKEGFLWMNELFDLMHQYTSQRKRYPTFDSFMPVVAQFYRDLPPQIPKMKADFNSTR